MSYSDGPCGGGNCLWSGGLADYLSEALGSDDIAIWSTWATFDFIADFEDDVLKETDTGRQILALADEHGPRLLEILKRDREVLLESYRVLLLGTFFARCVMAARFGRTNHGYPDSQPDPEFVERAFALVARLRELAEGELDGPIAMIEMMMGLARGLTASEIWELMQRPLPAMPSAT
jgi:hypothetical protein